jgi:hypothetical protein
MRFPEPAALREWRVFEVIGFHAEAGGNVVADEFKPCTLIGAELDSCSFLRSDPIVEAFVHGFGEWGEDRLLFESETDERDEIGKAAELRLAPGHRRPTPAGKFEGAPKFCRRFGAILFL